MKLKMRALTRTGTALSGSRERGGRALLVRDQPAFKLLESYHKGKVYKLELPDPADKDASSKTRLVLDADFHDPSEIDPKSRYKSK